MTCISLHQIERSVRANFVIDHHSNKLLKTNRDTTHGNGSIARIVFIGVAVEHGYTKDDICAFIGMTNDEYCRKLRMYEQFIDSGRNKFYQMRAKDMAARKRRAADDIDFRVYMKKGLVENYIRSHFLMVGV